MGAKFRVLGVNDEASDCCCCGRQGLKRVVWLQPLDEDGNDCGEPTHYGAVCGAKAAGWGYGADKGRIERRLRTEEKQTRLYYGGLISQAIQALIASGAVAITFGQIYTLPNDPITAMPTERRREEIAAAKARLRAQFPIFSVCDANLTALQLRQLLSSVAVG